MTDYNDGKWHGWNGGECPVHPESTVKYEMRGGKVVEANAGGRAWYHIGGSSDIIFFRVVTPYIEPEKPREWWATGGHLHDSREKADAHVAKLRADHPHLSWDDYAPVLVREVLE